MSEIDLVSLSEVIVDVWWQQDEWQCLLWQGGLNRWVAWVTGKFIMVRGLASCSSWQSPHLTSTWAETIQAPQLQPAMPKSCRLLWIAENGKDLLFAKDIFGSDESLHGLLTHLFTRAHALPSPSPSMSIQWVPDYARVIWASLADLLSSQVLEARSQWPSNIVILAGESILSAIAEGIVFISPPPTEVEPFRRCVRRYIWGTERIVEIVVRVGVGIQKRIPEWTTVGLVVQ